MSKHSNLQEQVSKLDMVVQSKPGLEAQALWVRLTGVLDSMSGLISEIVLVVRGDGNGTEGILQRVKTVEGHIGSIRSDIREIKSYLRILMGLEHDSEPLEHKKFTADDHPNRRAEDQQGGADRLLRYVVKYILPGVLTNLILAYILFQIAINNHLIGTK